MSPVPTCRGWSLPSPPWPCGSLAIVHGWSCWLAFPSPFLFRVLLPWPLRPSSSLRLSGSSSLLNTSFVYIPSWPSLALPFAGHVQRSLCSFLPPLALCHPCPRARLVSLVITPFLNNTPFACNIPSSSAFNTHVCPLLVVPSVCVSFSLPSSFAAYLLSLFFFRSPSFSLGLLARSLAPFIAFLALLSPSPVRVPYLCCYVDYLLTSPSSLALYLLCSPFLVDYTCISIDVMYYLLAYTLSCAFNV